MIFTGSVKNEKNKVNEEIFKKSQRKTRVTIMMFLCYSMHYNTT